MGYEEQVFYNQSGEALERVAREVGDAPSLKALEIRLGEL